MEAICSFEMSINTQQNTRRHIPEDDTLHNHRCENLKSYTEILGSNPIRGVHACLRLCCPEWAEFLRLTDPPPKEFYEMSV
jgi:hypothetical protein